MTDVTLSPISSGYNLSLINSNFEKVEQKINEETLHTVGGNNTMLQDLDLNNNALLNVATDPNNPGSLLTVAAGDARYYNVSGDTLTGPMQANNQVISGLRAAGAPTEAVRKNELDIETNARVVADINQQAQMTGEVPLMASNFSEISWHGQAILNSVAIPANKNAWSFGPSMVIASGQVVDIGLGSFWTIANGATTGDGTLTAVVPDPLDFGEL